MADEMGLGKLTAFVSSNKLTPIRKDTTVHRTTLDPAQAVTNSWQTNLRKGDRSMSYIACRQLGQRTR
jgi:hypothetical protein